MWRGCRLRWGDGRWCRQSARPVLWPRFDGSCGFHGDAATPLECGPVRLLDATATLQLPERGSRPTRPPADARGRGAWRHELEHDAGASPSKRDGHHGPRHDRRRPLPGAAEHQGGKAARQHDPQRGRSCAAQSPAARRGRRDRRQRSARRAAPAARRAASSCRPSPGSRRHSGRRPTCVPNRRIPAAHPELPDHDATTNYRSCSANPRLPHCRHQATGDATTNRSPTPHRRRTTRHGHANQTRETRHQSTRTRTTTEARQSDRPQPPYGAAPSYGVAQPRRPSNQPPQHP